MSIIDKIDLEDYRVVDTDTNEKSRVFAGRPRGLFVRNASKVDERVEKSDKVDVHVPDDIRALNPSFLEEFLFNIVKKYGPEGYKAKIRFWSEKGYKFAAKEEEGVRRILRRMSGLDK